MSRFEVILTNLEGLCVVIRSEIGDERGYLQRLYCEEELNSLNLRFSISQINHTYTLKAGTVRGMHYQHPPFAETKFVSCIRGEVFDVAIDVRKGSKTFLHWFGVKLSSENKKSLLIPKGFAHGFQTLVDDCELVYLHSEKYVADAEGALNAIDPLLGVEWRLPISEISERDKSHPLIDENFSGLNI